MREGYTGNIMESEFFGEIDKYKNPIEEYLPYEESVEKAKEIQPEKPKVFTEKLNYNIFLALKEDEYWEEGAELRIFTSVGSHLDIYHGVDAFVEYETRDGKFYRVTLDITYNKNKEEGGGKADVVFLVSPKGYDLSSEEDKDEFEYIVFDVASKVAELLQKKINNKEGKNYE